MLTKDKLAGAARAHSHPRPPMQRFSGCWEEIVEPDMERDDKLAANMFLSNVNPQIANQDRVSIQMVQFCRFSVGINKVHQTTSTKGKT